MNIVPKRIGELLSWAKAHAVRWAAAPGEIGLSVEQSARFAAASQAARDATAQAYAAQRAADSAAALARVAVEDLRKTSAEMLRYIKAHAEGASGPSAVIYAAAGIPMPERPAPAGPPGVPVVLGAVLNPGGTVAIRWSCRNPRGTSGTVYTVRRRVVDAAGVRSAEVVVGTVGEKRFTDGSIPAGISAVEYTVRGQRGPNIGGVSWAFHVRFGTGAGAAGAAKLAA